ncbi:MAG: LytTR family transcriptional regulator [Chitinophagaceae bacterium]|nr:LytTR family transcriptional regulator [Chitinophagaceae bacterium]
MNRNNYLRICVTVLLGISIPLLSGILKPASQEPTALLINCFFFIALTSLIAAVNRNVLQRLRLQPWLNDQPLKKITAIAAVNALVSVFIAGIMVYLWVLFTEHRTNLGQVLQFLAYLVLANIALTLGEELMLVNRERIAISNSSSTLAVETLPSVGVVLQQHSTDEEEDLPVNDTVITENATHKRKSRLLLRKGLENIPVKLDDIALFYTENKIVYALDRAGKKYVADKKLSELELELTTELFFRANRQFIIGLNFIKGFKPLDKVKLQVELIISDVQHQVIISQETAPAFRKWMSEA